MQGRNWFSFDPAIDSPAVHCGKGLFAVIGTSGAAAVVMYETVSCFFLAQGFSQLCLDIAGESRYCSSSLASS